jgi:hypothetical protein
MSAPAIRKHVVWLCAGCDDCEPRDGSEPSRYPCDNVASANGADVFECGPVLDLLEAHWRLVGPRGNQHGRPVTLAVEAALRANGRLT